MCGFTQQLVMLIIVHYCMHISLSILFKEQSALVPVSTSLTIILLLSLIVNVSLIIAFIYRLDYKKVFVSFVLSQFFVLVIKSQTHQIKVKFNYMRILVYHMKKQTLIICTMNVK